MTTALHPQLAEIAAELDEVERQFDELTAGVPPGDWNRRADPDAWSIAECVAHLTLSHRAFVPGVEQALEKARALGGGAAARLRRNFPGWLLWRLLPPPVRLRVKTSAPFIPEATAPAEEIIADFRDTIAERRRWLEAANGLPIDRVRLTSPFDRRVSYNLFAALGIMPRHDLRHIWQARRVREHLISQ